MAKVAEVIYATPEYQRIFKVDLSEIELGNNSENNCTVELVIKKSGILDYYPEIDLQVNKVGINSELKKLTDNVRAGDRVEIYRPLLIDPIEARRIRAKKQK